MGGGFLELFAAFALTAALRPVFVLVHELGHASVPLLRTRGRVQLRPGAAPMRRSDTVL
jgi:hypothetical protein